MSVQGDNSAPAQGEAGVTATERYLNRLARRSFLSLWSYPGVYRDQGLGKRGEGAEICDLLVVFENHILIFSDKDCEFPDLPNVDLAWKRWYKRTILKSAQQVWGAERWIRQNSNRVFLDRACTKGFPIDLPDPAQAKFHRIVVAHDTTGRRRRLIGGTGSLIVDPNIVGEMHLASEADGGHPFAVGLIDPSKGYVHVFDDASLGRVMRTLDTITDFINYLSRKEAFVTSGQLYAAYGEEDLLAYYLKHTNASGDHDFLRPQRGHKLFLEEGHWADFLSRPELQRKVRADRESYLWDGIIEDVAGHTVSGTLEFTNHPTVADQERMLRVLAREPRVRRRMLSRALIEKVVGTPRGSFSFRICQPSFPGDPYYVFVVGSPSHGTVPNGNKWKQYRERRRGFLQAYCMVVMRHFVQADCVIGIATESGGSDGRSHDFAQIERLNWNDELEAEARVIQEKTRWLMNTRITRGVEDEYPSEPSSREKVQKKIGRNEPCPCGSRRKFKNCHGP